MGQEVVKAYLKLRANKIDNFNAEALAKVGHYKFKQALLCQRVLELVRQHIFSFNILQQ